MLCKTTYETGNLGRAIRCAESVLKIAPRNVLIKTILGNCLFQTGEYDQAINNFESILLLMPDYLKPQLMIARSYWNAGKKKRAGEIYKKISQNLSPENLLAVLETVRKNISEQDPAMKASTELYLHIKQNTFTMDQVDSLVRKLESDRYLGFLVYAAGRDLVADIANTKECYFEWQSLHKNGDGHHLMKDSNENNNQ
jgi:tetratricopeptide (TPR) repeat protein